MNILTSIKRIIATKLNRINQKRAKKTFDESIIEKYHLNDPIERQKIIDQYLLIQTNPRAFGRKAKTKIIDKIKFMIHHDLIKVIE